MTEEETLLTEYNDYMNRIQTWKKNHGIFYKDIQKLEDPWQKSWTKGQMCLLNTEEHANNVIQTKQTQYQRCTKTY